MDVFDDILKKRSKIVLQSLGCKVNQAEVSELAGLLRSRGHEVVNDNEAEPEVIIINTCTVTGKSDYQSRQMIRRAARRGAKVIVTGCYSELNKEAVMDMDNVAVVIDNNNKHNIISMIENNTGCNASSLTSVRSRYFLKVQDGCDNSCSYCLIPRARGRTRSVPVDTAVRKAGAAAAAGYKEVVLTGIHLGQYGADLKGPVGFTGLVQEILNRTDVQRLRLSSLEINEIDDGLLELFSDSPRIARHLHVPLQCGDGHILALMNRKYGVVNYRERIGRISDTLGVGLGLGTDVIAGFPGETEREFENSLGLIEELPFTYLHVFPYSERPGTVASVMTGKVDASVIKDRCRRLRQLGEHKKHAFLEANVGRTLDVLLEDEHNGGGTFSGTAANYLKVRVEEPGGKRGDIVPVRVYGHDDGVLLGEAI